MASILIRGGTVVNADQAFLADVLTQDGKVIAAVGADLQAPAGATDGGRRRPVRDARRHRPAHPHAAALHGHRHHGRLLHRHGRRLAGGTTSIIDFVIPNPQQSLMEAYQTWRGWAEKSAGDYSFHVAVTWWDERSSATWARWCSRKG
jgi:dihydropyrimidinase